MTVDTQKLKELNSKSTQGEWRQVDGLPYLHAFEPGQQTKKHWEVPCVGRFDYGIGNLEFIAAAHNEMPALLEELDMLRDIEARNASLDKECGRLERENDALREALGLALKYWADRQQRYKNRSPVWVEKARAVLSPPAPPQGEKDDH